MALPGNIQNPRGGKPDKIIRDALMAAFRQSPEKLKRGAELIVLKYAEGDLDTHKYVADRIDGKAPQTIMGDADNPIAFTSPLSDLDKAMLQQYINQTKGDK